MLLCSLTKTGFNVWHLLSITGLAVLYYYIFPRSFFTFSIIFIVFHIRVSKLTHTISTIASVPLTLLSPSSFRRIRKPTPTPKTHNSSSLKIHCYNKAPASSSHFSHSASSSSFSALVLVSLISRFHSNATTSDIQSLLPSCT